MNVSMKPSASPAKGDAKPLPYAPGALDSHNLSEYRQGAAILTVTAVLVSATATWLTNDNWYLAILLVLWLEASVLMLRRDPERIAHYHESYNLTCLTTLSLSLLVFTTCLALPFMVDVQLEFDDGDRFVWLTSLGCSFFNAIIAVRYLRYLRKVMPTRPKK